MADTNHLPGRRRFGWYRPKANGTLDFSVIARPLEEDNWLEFRTLTRVVGELRPFRVDHMALSADFAEVRTAEMEIGATLSHGFKAGLIGVPAGVEANANAQRRVSNFLSAASAFRDRSCTRLRSGFGKDSEEMTAFEVAMSHAFDTSFAYRCLCQLRNFAQHHELPISFVPIDADRGTDGSMAARVKLQLFPRMLVATGMGNKKVRAELSALPADPLDLSALAAEYMKAHDGLMALVLGIYAPRLEQMAHYAGVIYRLFEVPQDAVPVIWEGDDPAAGDGPPRRAVFMGFDEMLSAFALREQLHLAVGR